MHADAGGVVAGERRERTRPEAGMRILQRAHITRTHAHDLGGVGLFAEDQEGIGSGKNQHASVIHGEYGGGICKRQDLRQDVDGKGGADQNERPISHRPRSRLQGYGSVC